MVCNHDYSLNARRNCLRHLSFNNFEGAGDCYAELDVKLGVSDLFVDFSYFASSFPSNAVKLCVG
jgi:hypothetical protein